VFILFKELREKRKEGGLLRLLTLVIRHTEYIIQKYQKDLLMKLQEIRGSLKNPALIRTPGKKVLQEVMNIKVVLITKTIKST